MKKLILIAILLILVPFTFAQEIRNTPPDYKATEQTIKDPESRFFYPKLLARLQDADETLTIEEFRHLYYGYTFQKEYQPYKRNVNAAKLQDYLRKQLEKSDVTAVEALANNVLKEEPFNVSAIRLLIRTNAIKGDDAASKKIAKIYQNIMVTILSTGDGTSCGTAFHVQSIDHEYVIMNLMKLRMQSQKLLGKCDYLEFHKDFPKPNKNGKQLDGFYFNISRLQDTFSIDQVMQTLEDSK